MPQRTTVAQALLQPIATPCFPSAARASSSGGHDGYAPGPQRRAHCAQAEQLDHCPAALPQQWYAALVPSLLSADKGAARRRGAGTLPGVCRLMPCAWCHPRQTSP